MKEKCCAVIASPPMCFPWGLDEEDEACAALRLLLLNRLSFFRAHGVACFVIVLDAGFGLYAAEMLNSLKENDPELFLICLVPWEGQATKWTPELRERYFRAQSESTEVRIVSAIETADCLVTAMLDAIDLSDSVIAVRGDCDITLTTALRYGNRLRKDITELRSDRGRFII